MINKHKKVYAVLNKDNNKFISGITNPSRQLWFNLTSIVKAVKRYYAKNYKNFDKNYFDDWKIVEFNLVENKIYKIDSIKNDVIKEAISKQKKIERGTYRKEND